MPVPNTMSSFPGYEETPQHLGLGSKRYSEFPSPEAPHLVSGGFPDVPVTLRRDDSRSEADQIGVERLRPPSGMASVAASSSISQRTSSPGTLGVKGYQYTPLRKREIRLV
jgi:hypothetical protein